MDNYSVKIYPYAYRNLEDIYRYLANEQSVPDIAKAVSAKLKQAILGLAYFPQSHQDRLVGRFANQGYKHTWPTKSGTSVPPC